jgi:hypothetical protein
MVIKTLAYYDMELFTDVKLFMEHSHWGAYLLYLRIGPIRIVSVLARLFQLNLMFASKSRKTLSGANTLAYYAHLQVTKRIKCCEYGSWGHIHNTSFSS